MRERFFIWSIEHNAWWRAGCCGYTFDISEAGQYARKEAALIVERANRCHQMCECMIPCGAVDTMVKGM